MKTSKISLILSLTLFLAVLIVSCDKKTAEPEHVAIDIEMSYTPNPATAGTVITITFEPVVEGDGHDDGHDEGAEELNLSMVTCEVGSHDGGSHSEMNLAKDDHENHYEGTWTFDEAGHYEIHFNYMHDDEMLEKAFEIEVL